MDAARLLAGDRFHDLRRMLVSLMLNHSLPVISVSKVLGLTRPGTTFDIDAHLYNNLQDEKTKACPANKFSWQARSQDVVTKR